MRRGRDHHGVNRSVWEQLAEVLDALGPLALLTRRVLLGSGLVQLAVHVANGPDFTIVAIQKPRGQRVAPVAADANHRQHEPVVGRRGPDGPWIGENRKSRGQTEGRAFCLP